MSRSNQDESTRRDLYRRMWPRLLGMAALLWLALRSGTSPRRLSYPCQRAALPLAAGWFGAAGLTLGGSLLLRRLAWVSGALLGLTALIWSLGALPVLRPAAAETPTDLPTWEVAEPVSTVFVMENLPLTSGSLAAGDETVPDEHLSDPAMDRLLDAMADRGLVLHRTAAEPEGLVGATDIVVIKGNFQWTSWNTTSTDRIKGLVRQILIHPDGFTGEILICDNTQEIGTGVAENDNNSEDPEQSILDVTATFAAKGHPVACFDFNQWWDVVVEEYDSGDLADGHTYDPVSQVSYPKFRTPILGEYLSLRQGVWSPDQRAWDPSRLCIINFPVLKAHGWAGSSIAVKNWVGVMTTAYAGERYGGSGPMHSDYIGSEFALAARVMAETFPRLSIVDATWTSRVGPVNLDYCQETRMLVASTDPVAASWYAANYILSPIALYPEQTDPDGTGSYHQCLTNWTAYLRDEAGWPCTMDPAEMSVYPAEPEPATPTPAPPTPTAEPSPEPTSSPEPTAPAEPGVSIRTNRTHYRPGDRFRLSLTHRNPGAELRVDEYVVLDIQGAYWFWPGWSRDIDLWPDRPIPTGTQSFDLLDFSWPEGAGAAGGLRFWAGWTSPGETDVVSLDGWEWSYGS